LGQIAHGFGAGFAGAHFEVDEAELLTKFGVGVVKILGDAHERLIETETGFNAYYGEIKGIWEREADAELAFPDGALEQESRKDKAEEWPAEKQERGRDSDSGEQANDKSEERAKDTKPGVESDAFRVPVPCLHEHEAGAGGAVGGERKSLAERIKSLLEALPHLGFVFGALGVVASERPQAFSQDRERGGHRCTEKKDDGNNGQKDDDGNYDFHGLGCYQFFDRHFFRSYFLDRHFFTPESE
jgi:hypothetical protein